MSAQEIEEKMNLDESPCCPRRSRRKRRRLGSNSEEEDETYSPVKANGISTYVKRKPLKKYKPTTTNGVTREVQYRSPIPIRPRPPLFLSGQSLNAEPSAASRCENSVVNPESIVLPPPSINSNTSVPSRFDPNTLQQQPSLYHTSFMNTSRSTAYIRTPITVNSATRIILPPQPPQLTPYQSSQSSSYPQSSQSLQSSPNTMVSIPNPVDKHGRSVFLLPKPKDLNITLTPNIIELDSDSDDDPSVTQNNFMIDGSNNMDDNVSSNKVVPVALTWENNDDDVMREEQPLREIRVIEEKNVSLSEMMLPHNRELDKLLNDTKEKIHNLFKFNNATDIEVEAQQRIKHFYYNMRDTVVQLVHINDRIIRQYIEWRRSWKTEKEESSSTNKSALVSQENVDIPLDMICVNDSDTESECEDQGYQITKPSDLVKDNNIIKDLLFCKNVVHRGVGDDSVHYSADKAIQVYDTVSRDYEKCIGYSLCTKTDQTKIDDGVENLPVESDKNFGKYEEQFIFYLQHIEDNGIKIENTDSDEMSLQEVVQTNSPFISHLFQEIDIGLSVASTDQLENANKKI